MNNNLSTDGMGRKGPQFLTMTRADFAAYEYLVRQSEAKEWIEEILQEKLSESDLANVLHDGVVLCKLANTIWAGSVPKWNGPHSYPFLLIENINLFLQAVKASNLLSTNPFSPIDLFEKKNMPLVLNTLFKLAESAEKNGFKIKWKKRHNLEFNPKEIQEAKKLEGVNLWGNPSTGPSKSVHLSDEEQRKRNEAALKKKEAELKAQEDLKRKQEEQERERQEQLRREAEELARKKQEEERRRKEASEEEERRRKLEEEELERIKVEKYGGKANLNRIRDALAELQHAAIAEEVPVLHVAVAKQLEDVVRYLLEEMKVDANKANQNGDTALHVAATKDNEKIVSYLVKAGSKVDLLDRDGNTPLHNAARQGKAHIIRKLVDSGADTNARNNGLDTPLIIASKTSHAGCIEELVVNGADVNLCNKEEETALHIVASNGSVDMVHLLWESGKLELNPRNKDNATPLQLAAECEHFDVVKRLVELGADLNTKRNDGWSPLYTAAYNGDYNTVVLLLSKGADVDGANEEGWTPLHAACAQGNTKVVKTMVEDFSATINILNEQGTSPLFHAVSAGRRTIVDYLVSKGADVDLSKEGGWKPIHAACYNEFEKLTTFLVEHGVSLSGPCKDIKGYTALHILISSETAPLKLIDLLVKKGARLNVQNDNGSTPLHLAVFWSHYEVVELLVTAGANMEIKNDKGRTPLDLAGFYGHKKIAEFLAKKSGKPMPEMKSKARKTRTMDTPDAPPQPETPKK